jgi:hypothetical protein
MKIFDKEFPDLPGLNPNIDVSSEGEKSVSIKVSQENIETLREKYAIDVESMVQNVILNEIYIGMGRFMCQKALSGENTEEINDLFQFLEDREEKKDLRRYIITGIKIGAMIQDYPGFVSAPLESLNHPGSPYLIGIIGESEIYVDPYLKYSDNRLGMFSEGFWNYETTSTQIEVEGTSSPSILSKYKIKAGDPKSEIYLINDTN